MGKQNVKKGLGRTRDSEAQRFDGMQTRPQHHPSRRPPSFRRAPLTNLKITGREGAVPLCKPREAFVL